MQSDKLKTIIKEKNEEREREALRECESLIESIAAEQRKISQAQIRIGEFRKQLKELEVEQLDHSTILGGE